MWIYKLFLLAVILSSAYFNTSQAKPAAPLRNVQVAGQVFFAGQPAAGVTVQAKTYNCLNSESEIVAKAISDARGYYRLRIPSAPSNATHIAASAGKLEDKAYANYCNPNALTGEDLTSKTKRFNINLLPATTPSAAETQCLKAKGEWGWLNTKVIGCNFQYSDAWISCTDGKQCKGNMCLINRRFLSPYVKNPVGSCTSNTYMKYNARAELRDGKVVIRK